MSSIEGYTMDPFAVAVRSFDRALSGRARQTTGALARAEAGLADARAWHASSRARSARRHPADLAKTATARTLNAGPADTVPSRARALWGFQMQGLRRRLCAKLNSTVTAGANGRSRPSRATVTVIPYCLG